MAFSSFPPGFGSASLFYFSSRGGFLYLGVFTKVVSFDDTMAAATIREDQNGHTV